MGSVWVPYGFHLPAGCRDNLVASNRENDTGPADCQAKNDVNPYVLVEPSREWERRVETFTG